MMDSHLAVGSLITGKIAGTSLDTGCRRLIENGTIGGVTLFKENVQDLEQLLALIEQCHQLAPHPFLVAVDQEGGAVQRFDDVITPLPSALALAANNDRQAVRRLIQLAARQLRWLGVNCNLAPVLDVNSNPLNPIIGTRSFGGDAELVTRLGEMLAQIYVDESVLPVGKHFPGHGDTAEDSHLALAVAHADRDTLIARELYPFASLAKTIPALMVGHVWLPAFEDKPLPATLSRQLITGLLRQQLHFNGYIFTDDLPVMKAIMDHYGLEQACLMAMQAGVDNLLISGSNEQLISVHAALTKAYADGAIDGQQLAQTLHRRANVMQICMSVENISFAERRTLLQDSFAEGLSLAEKVSAGAVALVQGTVPNLRASTEPWHVLVPVHRRYVLDLRKCLLAESGCDEQLLVEQRYPLDPSAVDIDRLIESVRNKKCLLLTFRALNHADQLLLARRLAAVVDKESVLIACDVPYEAVALKSEYRNTLATFDPSQLAMAALAQILTGKAKACGKLPDGLPPF